MGSHPRLIEVRKNVLKQNDIIARSLRDRFRAAGVFVVSLVSSPGSGKTMFLEKHYLRFAKIIASPRSSEILPPRMMPSAWREARRLSSK